MSKPRKPDPDAAARREQRLAAALRANLARRKSQARARAEQDDSAGAKPQDDAESED